MSTITHLHQKSVGDTFPDNGPKLPFLSKRVHPLEFYPPKASLESFNHHDNLKQFQIPKPKYDPINQFSPLSMQTYDIPPLKYSSFKSSPDNLRKKNRRKNSYTLTISEHLENKYHINVISEPQLDRTKQLKQSLAHKRGFKRIEPHEIKSPSNTLGEKLVRMHKLVIDPLLKEGDFLN